MRLIISVEFKNLFKFGAIMLITSEIFLIFLAYIAIPKFYTFDDIFLVNHLIEILNFCY